MLTGINELEILTFFAVLVRFSVLFAVVPFLGDNKVPAPVKILLAVAVTVAAYPGLVASGRVKVAEAAVWADSGSVLVMTLGMEVAMGLALGFCAKLAFDAIAVGANLCGTLMGFSSASTYDPHQESQTEVVAQIHTTIAMLLFLAMDGHHWLLRALLDSYKVVGIGRAEFGQAFSVSIIQLTGDVLRLGLQIAAPVAVSLFGINMVYGLMARTMPQMNVMVLSFSVSTFVGLTIYFLSLPEFGSAVTDLFALMADKLRQMMLALKGS